MKATLEKRLIKPFEGEPFYIYVYTEEWRFQHSPFYLPHKNTTFEEYDHLLWFLKSNPVLFNNITKFIGINKEELIEDLRRKEHEVNVE